VFCCTTLTSFAQNIVAAYAKPAVFAPGIVSTLADEFAPSFMPDGKTVYFSRDSKICFSKLVNGKWSDPKVASFSGQWNDMDSFISLDGKRLYFSSYRPLDNNPQSESSKFAHIWYVDHLPGDNWSAPHHLEAPVNLDGVNNYAPSISRAGTLFFFSPRRDSRYPLKSYYAKWLGDHYGDPKPLLLNDAEVKDTFVAPDESYLLFTSGKDIYISYRNSAGWDAGKRLEPWANDGAANAAPYVSPDGKTLYYSSGDVHGISMVKIRFQAAAN
jgi:Tol biopolymer transport system component